MGGTYYVPRSVKGESRILYIFTIKSFAVTLAFGLVGVLIYFLVSKFIEISIMGALIIIAIFAAIGYALSAVTIPDSPAMGPLRKAGGENIGAMLIRLITFKKKKKIYLYNYKRNINQGGDNNDTKL